MTVIIIILYYIIITVIHHLILIYLEYLTLLLNDKTVITPNQDVLY